MNVQTPHSLPPASISAEASQSATPPSSTTREVAGNMTNPATDSYRPGTAFIPLHAFNLSPHPMGESFARRKSLVDRMRADNRKKLGKSRSASSTKDDAIDPVAGRERTAEVSLVLNLLRGGSDDDQRNRLEEDLKARKLSAAQRVQIYMEAVDNVDREGLPAEDAARIRWALMQSVQEIQSENRHAIRRSIQNPEELRAAVEKFAGSVEKLQAVMRRELRNRYNPDSPRTEMDRVDVPYKALHLLEFAKILGGAKHCRKSLAALRKMTKYEPHTKLREVPDRNFARYWLATSDDAAFNLAQSAIALGGKLRTEIAQQARIAPALPAADIGVLMLSAADGAWGKGNSKRIVKEITGQARLDSMKLAKVYTEVYNIMHLLPETAWAANRMSARQELLAELKERGYGPAMPVHSIKEEIAEQEWHRKWRENRPSAKPGKQGID